MILITGAAGKTGLAVIRALHRRKKTIRAMVHKEAQVQLVQGLGVLDVLYGDMRSQKTMDQICAGISAIYHICPNVSPDEMDIGQIVIKAAQTAQVEHFVYHSVLHPQTEAMPHHWQKMRVEEMLFESSLPYTILQPAPYMQNILAYWEDIVENGRYAVPYSAKTRVSAVDLEDVAEVTALVLCEAGHQGATYELCGAEILSQNELAQQLSQSLEQRVDVEVTPMEEWAVNARNRGLGTYQVNALIQMFRYYEQFGLTGNPNVLKSLLGRSPTTYADFIARTINDLHAK